MKRVRVLVNGAFGRMGTVVCQAIAQCPDLELVARCGRGDDLSRALAAARPDVAVDFTTPAAVAAAVQAMLRAGVAAVLGDRARPSSCPSRCLRRKTCTHPRRCPRACI